MSPTPDTAAHHLAGYVPGVAAMHRPGAAGERGPGADRPADVGPEFLHEAPGLLVQRGDAELVALDPDSGDTVRFPAPWPRGSAP
ncbi:hypothetical protein [Streptomyces canarius]